jgi:hypothetical protein
MSELKSDFEAVPKRFEAWWAVEIIDRLLVYLIIES